MLKPKTIKMLRRIARLIQLRHKQIQMKTWLALKPGAGPCGTTACIAGWAVTLDQIGKPMPKLAFNKFKRLADWRQTIGGTQNRIMEKHGAKALGLTKEQADLLFYVIAWPYRFTYALYVVHIENHPGRTRRYAAVVAARIRHFIATNGAE